MTGPATTRQIPNTRRHWILGNTAIAALFLSVPMPSIVGLAAVALASLAVAVGAIRRQILIFKPISVLIILLALWLLLLVSNENVRSFTVALIGYRLSVTFFLGILLGYFWPTDKRNPLSAVWWSILTFTALSLIIFLYFPSLESLVNRRAGDYTALFQGRRRLQGLWPGPFHAAMASSFLILSVFRAKSIVASPLIRSAAFAIGLYSLYLTQVRTGIIAVLFGAVLLLLTQSSFASIIRIVGTIALASFAGLLAFPELFGSVFRAVPAIGSLSNILGDDRFLGRIDSWVKGYGMVTESPLLGYGPGSAGATLAPYFKVGGHVTPHNFFLKYAVEGGIPALVIVALIVGISIMSICAVRFVFPMGVVAVGPLLVFGTTGTTVEALPVSFALAVIVGVGVRYRTEQLLGRMSGEVCSPRSVRFVDGLSPTSPGAGRGAT